MRREKMRFYFVGIAIILFSITIVFRLVQIQTDPVFQEISEKVGNQATYKPKAFEAVRGNIYDRWGNLLAGNNEVYEIGVTLNQITESNKNEIINFISSLTGLNRDYVRTRIEIPYQPDPLKENYAVFSTIYRNATEKMVEEISMAQETNRALYPITWNGRLERTYPDHRLGANVLGFYSSGGFFGVEGFYDNILSTIESSTFISMNPYDVMEIPEIPHGASVILTIDREIQARMEEILDRSIKNSGSSSGTVIVMDPKTGEILAMATTPRANLNQPSEQILAEYPTLNVDGYDIPTPFNRAIMQTYEPGSVFKVFTLAAALDSGAVTPETEFLDTGVVNIGGMTIYNWDYGAWGYQDMTGCMQHSLNVCLVWMAQQTTTKTFYEYLSAFNIDRKTNIDMEGEASFPFLSPSNPTPFGSDPNAPRWYEGMIGPHSFGQGVSVTPIRMITSIAAIANDGRMMAPHIQKAVVQDGRIRYYNPKIVSTPIKPETAHTITEMLAVSLEKEASDALVEGYRLAGKTGTAEIPSRQGYVAGQTNASFVGWGPVDDPKFIVYIWLEKPQSSIWSSVVVSPVFSEIVENLVILMDIPPDKIRMEMASSQ
ncbi:Cell division protein FtsI (Peptidoglycan synthetase) [Smithella sp. ME-1]|nr:Cell division protein FtsI (Peptidoglycan synthetase) [Smithella sp. ME-1]